MKTSWVYTVISALAYASKAFDREADVLAICKKAMAQYDKEQAVIKAARRYIWANEAGVLQGEFVDLRDTIEALDKAEVEGE